MDPRCKGMPLSSFILKPMQRVTRYPLIIKNVSTARRSRQGCRAAFGRFGEPRPRGGPASMSAVCCAETSCPWGGGGGGACVVTQREKPFTVKTANDM